jgi:phage-related protein
MLIQWIAMKIKISQIQQQQEEYDNNNTNSGKRGVRKKSANHANNRY